MGSHGFVGDLLIRAGVVDGEGFALGLEARAREPTMTLGRALASLGLASEPAVATVIASAMHLEFLDGDVPQVDAAVVELLPAAFCRPRGVAPLGFDRDVLRLAVLDPTDYMVLQDTEFRTGKRAVAVVVTQTWFETLFGRMYPDVERGGYDMLSDVTPSGAIETAAEYELVDPAILAKDLQLPPIVKLVNLILSDAAKAGASDVHIEPHETQLHVRQRVDGQLRDVLTIPHHLQNATISRLKIMSEMDISERRKPQDGRSRLRFEGRRIDLRVSTMPTQFGEKVVIRLLKSDQVLPAIDQIGLSPENLSLLQSFLSSGQGMILVTGPTGSGKTSTLYSSVASVKSASNNIVTLEDPIEIQIAGVNQMQVNPRAGVTFATGLRSILRQDPNIILVGEIRDRETADIAFGAAQTGHLLLSTLHTNDATATLTRLFDLGIQPFLVASSLLGIVAQRLVRRPCPACAMPREPSADLVEKVGGAAHLPPDGRWVVGLGCSECGHTGLKGRIAIHEVLAITDEVRDLISSRAAEHVIKKAARRTGMRTLLEDGIEKAAQGLTTLEEVLRVAARDEANDPPVEAAEGGPDALREGTEAEAQLPRGRVLVVEDSPTIVEVVKYFLELEGLEVLVASDGFMGLKMALQEQPDVIVSDVNMPGMGGVAMVKALRADARTSHTPILMLTSEASVESETEGLAAGADDYVLKPVEPRRLAARVKALRARSRAISA